ncbi:MAG: ribonuclease P protein component [Beijerinckiaceae bacterium]|nr:ribonuclease P protein component [Beijerinckiaceae bacterium]
MTGSGASVTTTAPHSGPSGCSSAPWPEGLRNRAQFLNVAKGARFHAASFSLQAIARKGGEEDGAGPARFGFTVTRKAGGSVERNRMRRRLREALRRAAPLEAKAGFDYVIVARREALGAEFDRLVKELGRAMRLIGDRPARSKGRKTPSESR